MSERLISWRRVDELANTSPMCSDCRFRVFHRDRHPYGMGSAIEHSEECSLLTGDGGDPMDCPALYDERAQISIDDLETLSGDAPIEHGPMWREVVIPADNFKLRGLADINWK